MKPTLARSALTLALTTSALVAQDLNSSVRFDVAHRTTHIRLDASGAPFGQAFVFASVRLQRPTPLGNLGALWLDPAVLIPIEMLQLDLTGHGSTTLPYAWGETGKLRIAFQAAFADRRTVQLGAALALAHGVVIVGRAVVAAAIEYKPIGAGGFPILKYDVEVKTGDIITVVKCPAGGGAESTLSEVTSPRDGPFYGSVPNPPVASGDTVKVKVNGVEVASTKIP